MSPLNKAIMIEDEMERSTMVYPSGFKNSSYLNFTTFKLRTNLVFRNEEIELKRVFYFDQGMRKFCVLVGEKTLVREIHHNQLREMEGHKICVEEETLEFWKVEKGYIQVTPTQILVLSEDLTEIKLKKEFDIIIVSASLESNSSVLVITDRVLRCSLDQDQPKEIENFAMRVSSCSTKSLIQLNRTLFKFTDSEQIYGVSLEGICNHEDLTFNSLTLFNLKGKEILVVLTDDKMLLYHENIRINIPELYERGENVKVYAANSSCLFFSEINKVLFEVRNRWFVYELEEPYQ